MKHARLVIFSLVSAVVIFLIVVVSPHATTKLAFFSTQRQPPDVADGDDDGDSQQQTEVVEHVSIDQRFYSSTTATTREAIRRLQSVPEMIRCGGKFNLEHNFLFWNVTSAACERMRSVVAVRESPARGGDSDEDDVSPFEMKCKGKSRINDRWLINAFSSENPDHRRLTPANTLKTLLPALEQRVSNPVLLSKYAAFTFYTSFLFRQFKPWMPQPETTTISTSSSSSSSDVFLQRRYRGFHDTLNKRRVNLYVIENFCLSPFSGLSGYDIERADAYVGRSDTRDAFRHEEYSLRYLLAKNSIQAEPKVPDAFDTRPVILFPLQPRSRFNLAHQIYRFMSLIGILDMLSARSADIASPWLSSDTDDDDELKKPLLVIISPSSAHHQPDPAAPSTGSNSKSGKNSNPSPEDEINKSAPDELRRVTMLGFLFRILDLPIAAITPKRYSNGYYAKLFNLTGHDAANSFAAVSSSASPDVDARVCFHRGFVWQNCYDCEAALTQQSGDRPVVERESYSFGNMVALTPQRQNIVVQFRRLFQRCWPSTVTGSLQHQRRRRTLPSSLSPLRVFVDLRTSSRAIRDVGLMLDRLREDVQSMYHHLVPVADNNISSSASPTRHRRFPHAVVVVKRRVIFTVYELRNAPSRAQYLADLVNSDIQICVHGGSCVQDALFVAHPRRAVLLELSPAGFHCASRVGCWWAVFTQAIGHSHLEVRLPEASGDLVLSYSALLRPVVEMAVCRQHFLAEREDDRDSSRGTRSKKNTFVPEVCLHLRDVRKEPAVTLLGVIPLAIEPSTIVSATMLTTGFAAANAASDFVSATLADLSARASLKQNRSFVPIQQQQHQSLLSSIDAAMKKAAAQSSTVMRLVAKTERDAVFWRAAIDAEMAAAGMRSSNNNNVYHVTAKEEDIHVAGWKKHARRFIVRFDFGVGYEPAHLEVESPLLVVHCVNATEQVLLSGIAPNSEAAWGDMHSWSARNTRPYVVAETKNGNGDESDAEAATLSDITSSAVPECLRLAVVTKDALSEFHLAQMEREKRNNNNNQKRGSPK